MPSEDKFIRIKYRSFAIHIYSTFTLEVYIEYESRKYYPLIHFMVFFSLPIWDCVILLLTLKSKFCTKQCPTNSANEMMKYASFRFREVASE